MCETSEVMLFWSRCLNSRMVEVLHLQLGKEIKNNRKFSITFSDHYVLLKHTEEQ